MFIEPEIYDLAMKSTPVRLELADADPAFFAEYYLHEHFRQSTGGVSSVHEEWLNIATNHEFVILGAPRDHAKSTTFSLAYPLHQILNKHVRFVVLISDTATQAEELLGALIEELETNDRIIKDYGKIAGYTAEKREEKKKWTASEIVTLTGIKVIARGWKSKLRGLRFGAYRPDLIVVDDIENDENVQNDEQRIKVKNVFYKSILNLGNDAQKIIVGTILHFDSLLAYLMLNPPPGAYVKLYKAIKPNNSPLWKARWSMEKLMQKKAEIGTIPFEQEYMNNPLDPSQQILKIVSWWSGDINLNDYDTFGFIDLAISEKQTADYTAIGTIGRHKTTKKYRVLEVERFRGSVQDQLNQVFIHFEKWGWEAFGVESVAYQKAFYQLVLQECRNRNIDVPVVEVEVDTDKIRKAIKYSPYFENGSVEFNPEHQQLVLEVTQFPKSGHDDMVDAVLGGLALAITRAGIQIEKKKKKKNKKTKLAYSPEYTSGLIVARLTRRK